MSYSKYYNPTNWENYPSEDTAVNAMHLNNLEDGVDTLDDRIVALSTDKSEVSWNQTLISGEKIAEITVNGITKDVYAPEISDSVVEQAAEQALKSEGYAVGTQGDVPVTSGLYYHNNSKYYSEQASDSASDAAASAVEAGQSADGAAEEALVSEGWATGKQNGVPVEQGSSYYHNNAKYYCDEARHFTPEGYQELADDIDYYEQNGYLSKNLFKVVAKTTTEQGVLYTVNNDGTITTTRQSTSSSNASINIGDFTLPVGSYKISGANNAGNGAYFTLKNASNNAFIANIQADGYDLTVTDASFAYRLTCVVSSSVSPTGDYATVSPMVRKSDANSAYTPYAPSNNTLNSKKADISAIGTDESGRTTASRQYAYGERFYKDGKFCRIKTTDGVAQGATWTLGTNYTEGDIASSLEEYVKSNSSGVASVQAKTNEWMIVFANGGLYTLLITTAFQYHALNKIYEASGISASYNTSTGILSISGIGGNRNVFVKRIPLSF